MNFLGGKASSEIEMPELETSPMVYFGCISKHEPYLKSVNFDLHLICPLFIDLQSPVFLDYSNPKKPTLIRDNVPSYFSQYFQDIPNSTYIEYKKINFSFDKVPPVNIKVGVHNFEMVPGEIGQSGIPNWIHDEDYPNCPLTGNRMQFLFQLSDVEECKTLKGQDVLDKESLDAYLHFGHGYIYVFYAPESKVVAYLNQL